MCASNAGRRATRRGLPRAELGKSRAGEVDVERDRMLQVGLQMKAIKPGAQRPHEQIPHVSARERLLDSGLGPLPEQGRPQAKSRVDRVVIEAGQVEHRVDQLRMKV